MAVPEDPYRASTAVGCCGTTERTSPVLTLGAVVPGVPVPPLYNTSGADWIQLNWLRDYPVLYHPYSPYCILLLYHPTLRSTTPRCSALGVGDTDPGIRDAASTVWDTRMGYCSGVVHTGPWRTRVLTWTRTWVPGVPHWGGSYYWSEGPNAALGPPW